MLRALRHAVRHAGHPAPRTHTRAALPGCCEVCGRWHDDHLCTDCSARFGAAQRRCQRCALVLPAPLTICHGCLREPPPYTRSVCAVDYGFPWDRLIARFKYAQSPELAGLLAAVLAAAAEREDTPRPQAFVAVPLSTQRLAARGYDQAWELTRRLARHFRRPAHARALERQFDVPPQAQLARAQRLRNLQGAFRVPAEALDCVRARHLALVDDVMTTGATATEAARTLLAAGAARVDLWIVARTPAPADPM